MQESQSVLSLEQVFKGFPSGTAGRDLQAVRGVSLQIKAGEVLAVVGESGCGKSTLARMAAGILPVSGGSVRLLGRDITALSQKEWKECRKQVQMVFQDPSGVIGPRMKIGAFLREPFVNFSLCPRSEIQGQVKELLQKVELDESFLNKYPHQLSGGELQRVAIARALAVHPALLICDEPTSALDVAIQSQIIGLLDKLRKQENVAILFISHDLALVQQFADRILVMYLGSVVEELPAKELGHAIHPYTRALIGSVFRLDSREEIRPLEGDPPSPLELTAGCPFYGRCPVRMSRCQDTAPVFFKRANGHFAACLLNEQP